MSDSLLKTEQLAKVLNVSPRTVHTLREQGLPFIKLGRSIRFHLADVLAWIKSRPLNFHGWTL